jgi:hypothetical protein
MTTADKRPLHIRQAEGLRALADMIEANPEIADTMSYPLRYISAPVTSCDDEVAALAAFARACVRSGAAIRKEGDTQWFRVVASFGEDVRVDAFGHREEVCERVVTGTETVTKTVPDPEALATVPTVEVTEEVETVEWVCRPLLAAEQEPKPFTAEQLAEVEHWSKTPFAHESGSDRAS